MSTKIIIIEDDHNNIALLRLMLSRVPNCEAHIFSTFEELTASPIMQELDTFATILLDHQNYLSNIQGDAMFQQLRELGYPGPIGGFSDGLQTYVDFTFGKPFTTEMFNHLVQILEQYNGSSREMLAESFPIRTSYGERSRWK